MASAETARLIASLELQDKNFTRGLKNAERQLGKIDRRLGAVSGAVNRNLARGIDTVISKGSEFLVGTVKDAADFETAITGVAKTVEGDISGVTDELKKMSTEIPTSFVELAHIAELGGAMGIVKDDTQESKDALVAFTKQVAILGTTTDVSTEDAATALGQLQNIIGLTGDEFDNFAASLVDLGNKGASTESQILEIAKRSGGAAKLFGIAKDETLGWAAATANLALGQELGGTALQNLFIKSLPKFIQGSKTLRDVTGKTNKELKRSWKKDASGALQDFIADLSKLSKGERLAAIQKLYGKGSGLTRLLVGLSDDQKNLTDSLEVGSKSWKEATAAQAEAEKRFKTSESLFKRLDNSVKIVSATIGEALLPVLNDLATEAIDFLNKPGTQKGIKEFAKSIGEGVRSLAKIVTAINWGAVAGFLSTAAGFAGQLVTWFSKMPDWAQAFLIGGFAVTKLPIIGDIVTSALKGALGITAGIVNVNGPVAGGGMGGAAGAAGGASKLARIGNAVKIIGAVSIAGASIVALAEAWGQFQTTVAESQNDLQDNVNETQKQGFKETIANLKATSAGLKEMNGFQEIIASTFGGGQITQDFEMAADRIGNKFKAGQLTRDDMIAALGPLAEASQQGKELNLDIPKTNALLNDLITAVNKGATKPPPVSDPKDRRQAKPVSDPKIPAAISAQKQELGNIKNAMATLNTNTTKQTSAQTAELGNIKNATATLDTNTKTGLTTVSTGITTAAAAAATYSAGNILATGSTTSAVNTNAAATRGVAPPIVGTLAVGFASLAATIWAARPVIQSTNVVNNYTTKQRTGSTSGSRNGYVRAPGAG